MIEGKLPIEKTVKARLIQAKQLIEQHEYGKAQQLLKTINHPTAEKWLNQLDKRIKAPETISHYQSANTNKNRIPSFALKPLLILLIVLGIVTIAAATYIVLKPNKKTALQEHIAFICHEVKTDNPGRSNDWIEAEYDSCLAEMQTGFASIAQLIRDRVILTQPNITQDAIELAVVECSNTMLSMDDGWVWGSDTFAMCGDLYFNNNLSLIGEVSEQCYGRDIVLKRIATDDEHDLCVREIISMRVFVDYYPEDDDGLNITAPEFVGK